jgi:hypothetical protein
MNKYLNIVIAIILSSVCINAQTGVSYNPPVEEDATLKCRVITPLSVDPETTLDLLVSPKLIQGVRYYLPQNQDFKSLFVYSGEPNQEVLLSMVTEKLDQKVELSFTMKGSQDEYAQNGDLTTLNIGLGGEGTGSEVVKLNAAGNYYLYIIYDWVEAADDAPTGDRLFIQRISAWYDDI